MSKLFIHPYPQMQTPNLVYQTNRVGSNSNQIDYSIREMDRQTAIYHNPSIMNDVEQFPAVIKMDHNEIAKRLLDKIS
jgi:hypothetical protein